MGWFLETRGSARRGRVVSEAYQIEIALGRGGTRRFSPDVDLIAGVMDDHMFTIYMYHDGILHIPRHTTCILTDSPLI